MTSGSSEPLPAARRGAGAVGFALRDPRVVEVHWHKRMLRDLHFGDHTGYFSPRWQRRYLLPALDPDMTADSLRQALL